MTIVDPPQGGYPLVMPNSKNMHRTPIGTNECPVCYGEGIIKLLSPDHPYNSGIGRFLVSPTTHTKCITCNGLGFITL